MIKSFVVSICGLILEAIPGGKVITSWRVTRALRKKGQDLSYFNLGKRAISNGDYSKGIIAIQTAVEINPQPYTYWHQLGLAYEKTTQYRKAIAAYKKAISKRRDNSEVLVGLQTELGNLYRKINLAHQAGRHSGAGQLNQASNSSLTMSQANTVG